MKWAKPPLQRCIDYVHDADRILDLCVEGLTYVSRRPGLVEALVDVDRLDGTAPPEDEIQHLLDSTRERAKFAAQEIECGFPTLHAHTVVALWGALDALVSDLMTSALLNEPSVLAGERFARIKVPLAEYERLGAEGRMAFLAAEVARAINADLKPGVGKFEALLENIGLAGAVDDAVRRNLLEMSEVRNLLVHRAGIVDSRFAAACPWLTPKLGDKHTVTHSDYARYNEALHDYLFCLINRVRGHFGIEPYQRPGRDERLAP